MNQDVIKAIRLVYESLDSHLIEEEEKKKCCREAVGSKSFHKKCVKEYAFIIKVLADKL